MARGRDGKFNKLESQPPDVLDLSVRASLVQAL